MSREAPFLASDRQPRSAGWWAKMGIGGLLLLALLAITGIEARREQLRGVLREAADVRPIPRVPARPVFFQQATPGEALACLSAIPYWQFFRDERELGRTSERLVQCASHTELGEQRYVSLGYGMPQRIAGFAVAQPPDECVRIAFALLRASHDVIHSRRFDEHQSFDTQVIHGVHEGVRAAVTCGLRAPRLVNGIRDGLAELERDMPLFDGSVAFVRERSRREAYRWLARTAWDYDDPFFYDAGGLWARYHRQFAVWRAWRSTAALTELRGTNVARAGSRFRELRASSETNAFDLDLEHIVVLRSGQMLLGEPALEDPSSGTLMRVDRAEEKGGASCVVWHLPSSGSRFCAGAQDVRLSAAD